jgi:carbon-monoxide dehydrogenase medium subunit
LLRNVSHPASGFAVVGVAARLKKADNRITMARIEVTGLGSRAFCAYTAENLLETGADAAADVAVAGEGVDDFYASVDYRRQPARVRCGRAMATAFSRAS